MLCFFFFFCLNNFSIRSRSNVKYFIATLLSNFGSSWYIENVSVFYFPYSFLSKGEKPKVVGKTGLFYAIPVSFRLFAILLCCCNSVKNNYRDRKYSHTLALFQSGHFSKIFCRLKHSILSLSLFM